MSMAGFSPATLERIRAAGNIVDVIGSCLALKKASANFVALCPLPRLFFPGEPGLLNPCPSSTDRR
jgi:hypothetical protein